MHDAKKTLKKLWVYAAVGIVLFAVFLSIARVIVPLVRLEKPAIEDFTSRLLNRPVQITQVKADWYHLEPVLHISDVIVYNKDRSRALLKLKSLHLGFNVIESLLYWRLMPSMIIASGGRLTVHETDDGRIEVDGFSGLQTNIQALKQPNEISELLDLLATKEKIELRDISVHWLGRHNKVYPMTDLNFFMLNQGQRHQLAGSTKLSQTVPSVLHFVFDFNGSMKDYKTWQGQFYFSTKDFLIAQWWKNFTDSSWDITTGLLNCELWAEVDNGMVKKIQSLFKIENMNLVNTQNSDTTLVQELKGNLVWEHQSQGWRISGDKVHMRMRGLSWPEFSFSYRMNQPSTDLKEHVFFISNLNIDEVTPWIFRNFNMKSEFKKIFSDFQVKGTLNQFNFFIENKDSKISRWLIDTHFKDLSWVAHGVWPGITGLSGELVAQPTEGSLSVNSGVVNIDLGKSFKKKLDLTALIFQLIWRHQNNVWLFDSPSYSLLRHKDKMSGKFNIILPEKRSDIFVDMSHSFSLTSVQNYLNYLSKKYTPPKFFQWLRKNLLHDGGISGKFDLRGKLKDFPFEKTEGTFNSTLHLNDFTFTYFSGWPAIKNLYAELNFEKLSLTGRVLSGESVGLPLTGFTFYDTKVGERDEYLFINGKMNTTLTGVKNYLLSTHIKDNFKLLDRLTLIGASHVNLDLKIPIQEDMSGLKTDGSVEFLNSEIGLEKEKIQLHKVNGKLSFTKEQVSGTDLVGELFNEVVKIAIQSSSDETKGTEISLAGEVSIDSLKKQWSSFLLDYFKGRTHYSAIMQLYSDKNTPDEFSIESDLEGIEIELPEPFGKPADKKLSFQSIITLPTNHESQQFEFHFADYLTLTGNDASWSGDLNYPNAMGQFEFLKQSNITKVNMKLSRLYLEPDLFEEASNQVKPEKMPFLDVSVDDLQYGNKQFGKFTFRSSPGLRKMNIAVLNAESPYFTLETKGEWRSLGDYSETFLMGNLYSKDIANTLKSWDINPALESEKTKLNFKLFWPGAPYDFSIEDISGDLDIQLGRGRITQLDHSTQSKIGLGKVLGILSLQSIPRRLTLNFKDLTQKGFSFDKVRGHFSLKKGDAETHDTIIYGTVARVMLNGRIGLGKEDYNFMMKVEPYLTSSLPVVAVIAGGPIIGAAAFVADKIVGQVISKAVATTYHVTGSWEKPKVERMKRK